METGEIPPIERTYIIEFIKEDLEREQKLLQKHMNPKSD